MANDTTTPDLDTTTTTTTTDEPYRKGQDYAGTDLSDYQKKFNAIITDVRLGRRDQAEADERIKALQDSEFGPASFDIGEFEDLLSRLEGSKVRQQRQRSVEGRRDIMTQGLAGMMGNF
jgi:hypothetical protein